MNKSKSGDKIFNNNMKNNPFFSRMAKKGEKK